MKPITLMVALLSLLHVNLTAQTACDTALAGVNINLSMSGNCRLNLDSTMASTLISNYTTSLKYEVIVFDSTRTDTIQSPLFGEAIGQTYMVKIRPTNCPDSLTTEAWSIVKVEDKFAPRLNCVVDTMNCQDFALSEPSGIDECDTFTVDILALQYTPACSPKISGISTIATRTYRVTDASGNSSQCTDTTYIRRIDPSSILFPQDTMFACEMKDSIADEEAILIAPSLLLQNGTGTLNDQYALGVPTLGGGSLYSGRFRGCRTRAYYEDMLIHSIANCKYQYMRMWSVYEWYCDEELEYRMPQMITFEDTVAPVVTLSVDTLFYDITNSACEVTIPVDTLSSFVTVKDNCTPAEEMTIKYSYPYKIGAKSDSIITVEGADTIIVDITVADKCGKETLDSLVIIIRDRYKPVAICEGTVTVAVSNATNNALNISTLNRNSYDDCGGAVSFSARKMQDSAYSTGTLNFGCADNIEGLAALLRVTDASGNFDECMTNINLDIDTSLVKCDTASPLISSAVISGTVRYIDDSPVANADVSLLANANKTTTQTDINGQYEWSDMAIEPSLTIMPYKNDDPDAGISTMDLIMIQRHILGIADMPTAYQVIAGDANADNRLTVHDLIELRQLLLGRIDQFTNNDSYKFVPKDMSFEEPMDPWATGEIYGKTVNNMSSPNMEQDFVAIKVGDVNNSLRSADTRESHIIELEYDIIPMGQYFELNVYAPQELSIQGMQTTLSFDSELMRLMRVGSGEIPLKKENYTEDHVTDGHIAISWSDIYEVKADKTKPILVMTFENYIDADPVFTMDNMLLESEMYIDDKIYPVTLKARTKSEAASETFAITRNVPNPWSDETQIEFSIPKAAEVTLNVYDASMTKMYSDARNFEAGLNTFKVQNGDLPYQGLYFYEIIYADQVRVSKMTRL